MIYIYIYLTRFHPGEASAKDCMVVGLSSCHDHTVAMVMSIPEGSKGESENHRL